MSSINGKTISSTEVSVTKQYAENWERVFGKKKEEDKCSTSQENKQ